ncbi:transcription factor bHLH30-like isoform X2 [Andrographis paniculata]|nr:transcription factor bHLH30-like isoform X2 [Andrographis paniculata]
MMRSVSVSVSPTGTDADADTNGNGGETNNTNTPTSIFYIEEESSNPSQRRRSLSNMAMAELAKHSHKEAERRRRKRINAHIATLKSILPNTIKTDKASLLTETVRRVKELKKTTSEQLQGDGAWLKSMVPSETDEVKVCYCNDDGDDGGGGGGLNLIKATVACEDRPEMVVDLIKALNWPKLKLKLVRAEMCTLGGRTKIALWLHDEHDHDHDHTREGDDGQACLGTLLKMAIDKSILLAGNKRRTRCYHL